MENKIYSINGPVVTIKGKTDLEMMEMVYVGKARLVGEVIRMNEKETTIQVYEETGGLKAGEPVESTGGPLSVTLGPGILRNIYDGIQRPLPAIEKDMGSFIERGAHEPSLDEQAKWDVTVTVKAGDTLTPGQIYATSGQVVERRLREVLPDDAHEAHGRPQAGRGGGIHAGPPNGVVHLAVGRFDRIQSNRADDENR